MNTLPPNTLLRCILYFTTQTKRSQEKIELLYKRNATKNSVEIFSVFHYNLDISKSNLLGSLKNRRQKNDLRKEPKNSVEKLFNSLYNERVKSDKLLTSEIGWN